MLFMEETLQYSLDELYEYERNLRAHIDQLDDVDMDFETEDDIDWDGLPDEDYDNQSYTELYKQQRIWRQPTKRMVHPCDPDCQRLRERRWAKRKSLSSTKKERRRDDRREIQLQLCPSSRFATSVDQALPRDVVIDLGHPRRRYTVEFLADGRVKIAYGLPDNKLPNRSRCEATPKHLFCCHPAAPTFARLNRR